MRTTFRLAIFSAALLAAAATGDEPPAKKRNFIGSMQVPAQRRDELLRFLKEKGHLGAFVPDGAAPHTLLYRGTKEQYEAANEALNRHLHPEWYLPRGQAPAAKPKPGVERSADEDRKLKVSPLQAKLLAELRTEGKNRWETIQKAAKGTSTNLIEKGGEHNLWWREQHRAILTREQYRAWTPTFAEIDLGPEPKLPSPVLDAPKSDAAIFAQLGLSEKQRSYCEQLEKAIRAGRLALTLESDRRVAATQRAELDRKWREGLEHALTEKQLLAFRAYWDGK